VTARWTTTQEPVREERKPLGVAAALAEGPLIERAHLLERSPGTNAPPEPGEEGAAAPDELRGRIMALLEKHRGNVSGVARDMGKSRVQIHRWMQRFSIDVEAYRS
jgi:transcriptional regulator of acetoin/glycerol metabolism